MAAELGIKPVHLSGHLHALWHAVLEQQEDGNLSKWPEQLIADMAMWESDSAIFVESLKKHEFIDRETMLVHDWFDFTKSYLWKKYHTSNPRKYRQIQKAFRTSLGHPKGQTKRVLKDATRGLVGSSLSSLNSSSSSEESLRGTKEIVLPDWLDAEVWKLYRQHRAAMPKKNHMSRFAEKLAIAQLSTWHDVGHDPNGIVRMSIMNGWVGLFEPKNKPAQAEGELSERTKRILRRGL